VAQESFEDPNIEKIHVDVESAIKLFGSRLLNAEHADFSDALTNRHKGFGSGQYVLEIVGRDYTDEKETLEQKFRRLRCELEELAGEVETEKAKKASDVAPTVRKAELEGLNDLLRAATLKLDPTTSSPAAKKSGAPTKPSHEPSATTSDTLELRGLDERVKRIEQTVSGDGSFVRPHQGPLVESIENLRVQVESLNPVYLDGVNQNLSTAISKLNEYDDKRSKMNNDELEQKINKLYDLVSEWNVTCTNVPAIVKRLHTLSKLHEQAQEFASRLNSVSGLKQHVERKIDNQRMMLFELKSETAKIVNEFTAKVEELNKRMTALEK